MSTEWYFTRPIPFQEFTDIVNKSGRFELQDSRSYAPNHKLVYTTDNEFVCHVYRYLTADEQRKLGRNPQPFPEAEEVLRRLAFLELYGPVSEHRYALMQELATYLDCDLVAEGYAGFIARGRKLMTEGGETVYLDAHELGLETADKLWEAALSTRFRP
jgi:hypothetical protein